MPSLHKQQRSKPYALPPLYEQSRSKPLPPLNEQSRSKPKIPSYMSSRGPSPKSLATRAAEVRAQNSRYMSS
ncbi:hypothetical protein BDZ89DRAFT_1081240 [Hymenopellis radicata]|nr:hypothetical protein BDZ89DRAFT_1081240 [Hymenopellis radicata]